MINLEIKSYKHKDVHVRHERHSDKSHPVTFLHFRPHLHPWTFIIRLHETIQPCLDPRA